MAAEGELTSVIEGRLSVPVSFSIKLLQRHTTDLGGEQSGEDLYQRLLLRLETTTCWRLIAADARTQDATRPVTRGSMSDALIEAWQTNSIWSETQLCV